MRWTTFTFVPGSHPALHPGQTARIEREGRLVGFVGAYRRNCRKPWASTVQYSFSSWSWLKSPRARLPKFSELSRFPEVRRDLALIADREVAATAVLDVIRENAGEWLSTTSGYLTSIRVKALIRIEKALQLA